MTQPNSNDSLQWSPMPEKEARIWLSRWERSPAEAEEEGLFQKWTPEIIADNPETKLLLEKAVALAWEGIKQIREPCFAHHRPAIRFESNPIPHFGGDHIPYRITQLDTTPMSKYHLHHHDPELPSQIRAEEWRDDIEQSQRLSNPEAYLASRIFERIMFLGPKLFETNCGPAWASETRKAEGVSKTCPKCGEHGTGIGMIRNEVRFFHGPNRSCYLRTKVPKRKLLDTITCPKCGEEGKEHHGKDGHLRIRHDGYSCYVG